ncbi:MAG TPA: hypothetical protein VHV83_02310 [Armatimonadota bacterium]|nr:hypothetical protein [Armatimonadota bacterium]
MTINKICYRGGMLPDNAAPSSLPWRVWDGETLTLAICQLIEQEGLLELSGTYGDPSWGDPVQYDELVITSADGTEVRIICYNRALGLIFASTSALMAIHRAIGKLTR